MKLPLASGHNASRPSSQRPSSNCDAEHRHADQHEHFGDRWQRWHGLCVGLVPGAGLEPARYSAVDFESTASTDFATGALGCARCAVRNGRGLSHAGDNRSDAQRYKTLEDAIGDTPLVQLQRLPGAENERRGNVILGKLEGNNPAGSVKDRPAISMIARAEERGDIKPGDTLIEATSGNTGIALAMAAAIRGYRMVLIMPEDLSIERRRR